MNDKARKNDEEQKLLLKMHLKHTQEQKQKSLKIYKAKQKQNT